MSRARSPFPTEVRRNGDDRRLEITWEDGRRCDYDYDYLRGYCPCAECQGHYASAIRYRQPARSVAPVAIAPVGNYAISIHWSDGHSTGIYRFDFLREICQQEAEAEGAAGPGQEPGR